MRKNFFEIHDLRPFITTASFMILWDENAKDMTDEEFDKWLKPLQDSLPFNIEDLKDLMAERNSSVHEKLRNAEDQRNFITHVENQLSQYPEDFWQEKGIIEEMIRALKPIKFKRIR